MFLEELRNWNFDFFPISFDYHVWGEVTESFFEGASDSGASGFTVIEGGHIQNLPRTTDELVLAKT